MGSGSLNTGTWMTVFDPLTLDEWVNRYKAAITVILNWEKLHRARFKPTIHLLHHNEVVDLPSRCPRTGRLPPGRRLAILRAPAASFRGKFYLLDGTTRFKLVRPIMVVLDVIPCKTKDHARIFWDIRLKEW